VALYNNTVLDHFQHPRNAGALEGANAVGRALNEACGDEMQLYLEVEDGQVRRARFRTFGCAAAIAAGSALTELAKGSTLSALEQLGSGEVEGALGGLPPLKVHGAALAAEALRAALADYRRRCETTNPQPLTHTL